MNEYKIGVEALGRPEGYLPSEDNIVRVQARFLRQRLHLYFENEGAEEPLRLEIPKGSYVPTVTHVQESQSFPSPDDASPIPEVPIPALPTSALPTSGRSEQQSKPLLWLAFGVTTIGLALGLTLYQNRSLSTEFWQQVFPSGSSVLIVPSDTSLVTLQNLSETNVKLNDYLGHEYWQELRKTDAKTQRTYDEIAARQQTSMASMEAFMLLMRRPEVRSVDLKLRIPGEIRLRDVDSSQLVLIGARHSNPWVELYDSKCNFTFDYTGKAPDVVYNRAPLPGEYRTYVYDERNPRSKVYGIIDYLPNLTQGHSVLLIRGTGIAGTRAALRFMDQTNRFDAFLLKIEKHGRIPHFNVLVESTPVAGTAPPAVFITHRVLD